MGSTNFSIKRLDSKSSLKNPSVLDTGRMYKKYENLFKS